MVIAGVVGTFAVGAVLVYARRIDARADAVEPPDEKPAAIETDRAVGPIIAG